MNWYHGSKINACDHVSRKWQSGAYTLLPGRPAALQRRLSFVDMKERYFVSAESILCLQSWRNPHSWAAMVRVKSCLDELPDNDWKLRRFRPEEYIYPRYLKLAGWAQLAAWRVKHRDGMIAEFTSTVENHPPCDGDSWDAGPNAILFVSRGLFHRESSETSIHAQSTTVSQRTNDFIRTSTGFGKTSIRNRSWAYSEFTNGRIFFWTMSFL